MTNEEIEIAELAESISTEYFPNEIVNPEVIAEKKSITYDYDFYGKETFDGLIEHESGSFHIYMNLDLVRDPSYSRARFTFSHELGHYFSDSHRTMLKSGISLSHNSLGFDQYKKVEREANLFASLFLMPKTRFINIASSFDVGFLSILNLSKTFDTSRMSASFHYVNCDISPCLLVKWDEKGRIIKSCSSKSFDEIFDGRLTLKLNPNRAITDEKSVDVFGRGKIDYIQSITNMSSWAANIPYGGKKDFVIVEQTLNLSPYGGLSLIFPTFY